MRIEVTHNIFDYVDGFCHSITITNGSLTDEGKKVGYKEVARLGIYTATTEFYSNLPEVFIIKVIKANVSIKSNRKHQVCIPDYNTL